MNEDTYRLLQSWSHDKPRPVAMLAPLVVFAAEPLHTLLSMPSGNELFERCGQRDISWDGFYQSSTELFRALPPEFLELKSASRDAIADTAEFGVFQHGMP